MRIAERSRPLGNIEMPFYDEELEEVETPPMEEGEMLVLPAWLVRSSTPLPPPPPMEMGSPEELQLPMPPAAWLAQTPTPPSTPPMQVSPLAMDESPEPLYLYDPIERRYVLVENPTIYQHPGQMPAEEHMPADEDMPPQLADHEQSPNLIVSQPPSPEAGVLFEYLRRLAEDEDSSFSACRKLEFSDDDDNDDDDDDA